MKFVLLLLLLIFLPIHTYRIFFCIFFLCYTIPGITYSDMVLIRLSHKAVTNLFKRFFLKFFFFFLFFFCEFFLLLHSSRNCSTHFFYCSDVQRTWAAFCFVVVLVVFLIKYIPLGVLFPFKFFFPFFLRKDNG